MNSKPAQSLAARITGLAAAVIVFAICTGCAGDRDAAANRSDLVLVQRLLQHGEIGIQILELCQSKASADLKSHCATGFVALRNRNAELREWERKWAVPPPASVVVSHDQYPALFAKMRDSEGEEFDHAALRALQEHAHEGVSEAKACSAQAKHGELKRFCAELHPNMQRLLEGWRKWICNWFRDCEGNQ